MVDIYNLLQSKEENNGKKLYSLLTTRLSYYKDGEAITITIQYINVKINFNIILKRYIYIIIKYNHIYKDNIHYTLCMCIYIYMDHNDHCYMHTKIY